VDDFDPAALPRVVSRTYALSHGWTRNEIEHRLSTGRWRRVLPRTYLTADQLTWTDRCDAALVYAGHRAVLSGAAALATLPQRERLRCIRQPSTVLVLVPHTSTASSRNWVRVRRTHRMPSRAPLPGPARADLARAVADHALDLHNLDDVRTLIAQAVRAGHCTTSELGIQLLEGPRRGSAHLRRALADVGAGAWSAPEARTAALLRRAGLGGFVQNAEIRLPVGRIVRADFLWPELRAVLEIDSAEFHLDPADWRRTMARHRALEAAGYSVVHVPPSLVRDEPERFTGEIRTWLTTRRREST